MKDLIRPFVYLLIDIFHFFFHRNERVVVCAGWVGKRFADNSRYVFLYLNEHKQYYDLHNIVWITEDVTIMQELKVAGFSVCMKYSVKSIYYHLISSYFLYDQFSNDYITFLTRNAKLVNLWHGMPIKKFGLMVGKEWDLKGEYLLTCSDLGDKMIGDAFIVDPKHFIHGMYPRNHYLMHDAGFVRDAEIIYLNNLAEYKERGYRILFYLPTFRNTNLLFLGEENHDKIKSFFDFLTKNNYCLLTKLHFAGFINNKDVIEYSSDNFLNLPAEMDIYPFLKQADILITDYSSVLFDFLYLDKDIICYAYDLPEYEENDQGLILDYESLPADKVFSLEELQTNLFLKRTQRDGHSDARRMWLEKCFEGYTMDDTIKNILAR
nr:CDP-glycerol glycerophosphotransferase family protein [Parabacteroides goldsteinii]